MGTNCAPLLAGLFLYSYENEFLDNMIRSGHRRLTRSFNLSYRYTDDLIVFKPGLHIAVMVVSTVANMFLTLFQAVLVHVNTLITTSQASPAL